MKAYRIGRIQQPWINLEPPLRGGVYHKDGEIDESEISASDGEEDSTWSSKQLSLSSSASSVYTSTDLESEIPKETVKAATADRAIPECGDVLVSCTRRKAFAAGVDETQQPALKLPDTYPAKNLSRAAYTVVLEQKEILDGIRAYPSLDIATQGNIALEYKALHERIKNEGFYECRYSEYGKEAIRWTILFCAFIFLLNAKWYLTSAIFLGMFWVCQPLYLT